MEKKMRYYCEVFYSATDELEIEADTPKEARRKAFAYARDNIKHKQIETDIKVALEEINE